MGERSSPAKAPTQRIASENEDQLYIIEPTPVIIKDKLVARNGGELLSLNPVTGNIINRYDLQKIFKTEVVLDEYVDDSAGDVFSFAYNHELEKYVLFREDSEILVQRHGRGDSIYEYLDYHKGKLLIGSRFSGVFVLDAFNDRQIWWQPGRSMLKASQYQRLDASIFDREHEIVCALYRAKKGDFFLEAYNFIDGKILWNKKIHTHYSEQETGGSLFLYKDHLVFSEGLPDESDSFIHPMNKTFDILTGQEGAAFEGVYGAGWRQVDGFYYARYDNSKARWQGFIQGIAQGSPREVRIEGMAPAFGVKQFKDWFIYFSSQQGEMESTISPDDREIHLSGYSGIGTADRNTLMVLWHMDIGRQKAMPTLYEKEGVIAFGDPLGKGRISDLVWLYNERLADTAFMVDIRTGKVLWKAKIDGGRIARMSVWNDMAFIKTLSGNLFAIQWRPN